MKDVKLDIYIEKKVEHAIVIKPSGTTVSIAKHSNSTRENS
jgi:hypothetical protein